VEGEEEGIEEDTLDIDAEDMEVLDVEVLLWVCVEEFIIGATIEAEEF
jgi:hypothetical protein